MSDKAILDDLTNRVEVLEELVRGLLPKDMQQDLYGPAADHTEDRAARHAIGAERRSPGRPARI